MVVDTPLLAILFDEPGAEWAVARLAEHAGALRMSTVNLAETLILLRDRQPQLYDELSAKVLGSSIRFVAPDVQQSHTAARARFEYPLNLGDCFVYALAVAEGCGILTLDRDFRGVDRPVLLPPDDA